MTSRFLTREVLTDDEAVRFRHVEPVDDRVAPDAVGLHALAQQLVKPLLPKQAHDDVRLLVAEDEVTLRIHLRSSRRPERHGLEQVEIVGAEFDALICADLAEHGERSADRRHEDLVRPALP